MKFLPRPRKRGLVIILGAGASYGADVPKAPPVMNSFVRKGREYVESDYDPLWAFLERIGYSLQSLESGNPNLEELFTALQTISTGIWYTSRSDYVKYVGKEFSRTRPVDLLLSFIVEVLNSPSISAISRPCKFHNRLFSKLQQGDTVISFNYDLIADASLRSTVAWSETGGYGFVCGNLIRELGEKGKVFDVDDPCNVALLKPHGSLNWRLEVDYNPLLSSDDKTFYRTPAPIHRELLGRWGREKVKENVAVCTLSDIEDRCYKYLPIEDFNFQKTLLPRMTAHERQLFLQNAVQIPTGTYIIPPAAYKFGDADIPQDTVEIWSQMSKALSSARRILCVGYSFPTTDVEFSSLFRLSLLSNSIPNLKIEVINPDPSIVQKLALMAPSVKVRNVAHTLSEYVDQLG